MNSVTAYILLPSRLLARKRCVAMLIRNDDKLLVQR